MRKAFYSVCVIIAGVMEVELAHAQGNQNPYAPIITPQFSREEARVPEIVSVELQTVTIQNDGRVVIVASGNVPTSGWSGQRLSPWVHIVPPPDGIYHFDLVATPPALGTIVLQVVTELEASFVIMEVPAGFAGVEVHGQANSKQATVK